MLKIKQVGLMGRGSECTKRRESVTKGERVGRGGRV
jgi:hypothetical protein